MRPEASEMTGMLRETSAVDGAGDIQLRGRVVALGRGQRELLGMIHFDQIRVRFPLHLGGRRRFGFGVRLYFRAASGERKAPPPDTELLR